MLAPYNKNSKNVTVFGLIKAINELTFQLTASRDLVAALI